MKFSWEFRGEELSAVLALIALVALVCLINKVVIPKRYFQQPKRRLYLIGANGQVVNGGTMKPSWYVTSREWTCKQTKN